MIQLPPDFKEFLKLLNAAKVEYVVIGGYAVAYHGHPRATGDLDIWISAAKTNVERVVGVLHQFGFSEATADLFEPDDAMVRMGIPPVRLELMTSISGVDFDECFSERVAAESDEQEYNVIRRSDLVLNKRAARTHEEPRRHR